MYLVPVQPDLSAGRLIQTNQDVHQRRLSGAVLAKQGMDLSTSDREIDVPIGIEISEAFADILNSKQFVHFLFLFCWQAASVSAVRDASFVIQQTKMHKTCESIIHMFLKGSVKAHVTSFDNVSPLFHNPVAITRSGL